MNPIEKRLLKDIEDFNQLYLDLGIKSDMIPPPSFPALFIPFIDNRTWSYEFITLENFLNEPIRVGSTIFAEGYDPTWQFTVNSIDYEKEEVEAKIAYSTHYIPFSDIKSVRYILDLKFKPIIGDAKTKA